MRTLHIQNLGRWFGELLKIRTTRGSLRWDYARTQLYQCTTGFVLQVSIFINVLRLSSYNFSLRELIFFMKIDNNKNQKLINSGYILFNRIHCKSQLLHIYMEHNRINKKNVLTNNSFLRQESDSIFYTCHNRKEKKVVTNDYVTVAAKYGRTTYHIYMKKK